MKRCREVVWVSVFALFTACGLQEDDQAPMLIFSQEFDFTESDHGWAPGFSDYPAGPEDSTRFELRYAYTDQPVGSVLTKKSVMLSGNNLNHDLFMYLKRKVTGLKPNTDYTITFTVDLASYLTAKTASGAIYLKAGATNAEPKSVVRAGNYVMNIDKGNQSNSGADMISLGDLRTASYTPENSYALVTLNNTIANSRYSVQTDSNGELWLIIGTDSNLEGTSAVFYSRVSVVFSAS